MRLIGALLVLSLAGAVSAQGSISIFGQMTIQQGGHAFASGRVRDSAAGPVGSFAISFTAGDILSIEANKVVTLFVPGSTAGYEAVATAQIREGSVTRAVTGKMHIYVDDLASLTPPQPDQMILTFQPKVGPMIVRHGKMIRGDIVVTP
jgi:hypothetical protein